MAKKILPSDLGKVQLKKTSGPTHDASAPRVDLSDEVSEAQRIKYQGTVLEANVEEWLPILGELTFPTTLLPLQVEDAKFFIEAYETLEEKKESLSPQQEVKKAELIQKLEPIMKKSMEASGLPYVFVKLSSRSAKDAPVSQGARLRKSYRERLEVLVKDGEKDNLNTRVNAMLQAATDMLKMDSAARVLDFCMHSERIWQDMLLAMDHVDKFRESFVVRQWVPIDVDMEFRAFIHEGKLTCISQYNHLIHCPRVVEYQGHLLTMMRDCYESKIAPSLRESKLRNCVLDFAIVEDMTKVLVIEINPFLDSTDGCLYSWKDDLDIIRKGPLQLRVREKEDTAVAALISRDWRDILQEKALNDLSVPWKAE